MKMSTPSNPPEVEGAKERIIQAAVHLFSRQGYEATPVRSIVEGAGVTKPVLYYYFQNKEALFRAIVGETLADFATNLAATCEQDRGSLAAELEAIMQLYIETTHEIPERVQFLHTVVFSGHYEELFDFQGTWRSYHEMIAKVFDRAHTRDELGIEADSMNLAVQFCGMVTNIMQGIVFCPRLTEETNPAGNLIEIFLGGVGRRRTDPTPQSIHQATEGE